MKVFPVNMVEPAERFTRLTTTDAHERQTTLAETVQTVGYFSISVEVSFICL